VRRLHRDKRAVDRRSRDDDHVRTAARRRRTDNGGDTADAGDY
jgi:hypothetical protein